MPLPSVLEGRLRLPVIGAPLFIASNPALVIAQCKAGIVGSFPALNARPKDMLEPWIVEIKAALAEHQRAHPDRRVAPFAVNQICHASNDRLEHDVEVCVRHQVPIIITSLRPPADVVAAVHGYGGIVLHDVINVRHAEKALEQGVDGLILVSAGAGGHAGTTSPFALLAEVRQFYSGLVALAGSISSGREILAARVLGADLAYLGTRFVATAEANALDAYKQMICDSGASDILYSALFSGVHGNYLRGSVAASGLDPDNLPTDAKTVMDFGAGGGLATKAWRDIWGAGHGVGSIREVAPTKQVVAQLCAEYAQALAQLPALAAYPADGALGAHVKLAEEGAQ